MCKRFGWFAWFAVGVLWFASPSAQEQVTAIRAGRMFDARGGRMLQGQTILIRGQRIADVGANVAVPAGARVIDLSGATVLPGMIDAHVHVALNVANESPEHHIFVMVDSAQRDLDAGFTTIVDMDSREIEVDVNEAYINRVKPNQRVEAALDAYPDDPIAAHVINIVPTADKTKATVRVRIAFDKLDPRILPEMGIKVRFLDDQPPPQVAAGAAGPRVSIPSAALKREGKETYVFVFSDGHVERRAVTIGAENDGQAEVLGGLSGGEELVAPIVDGLTDGAKVKLKESNS